MKNVLNVVARIKFSKEILNPNIVHMPKQEHFCAVNVDMYLKAEKMKKKRKNNLSFNKTKFHTFFKFHEQFESLIYYQPIALSHCNLNLIF